MHRLTLSLAALTVAATTSLAQVHVIPNGTAAVAGNTSNAFPWGSSASAWPGLRLMAVYDSANFTAASINTPILISRLRWRANDSTSTWVGGTFTTGTVRMSTAAVDWSAVTTNFASNHGPDLTTVYTGPVTYLPGSGAGVGVPAPYVVDILLPIPFLYDPSSGDLNIDCDYPGGANYVGGSLSSMDVQSTGSMSSRVYASASYPAADGMTQNHGPVVEVTYAPAVGAATGTPYGTGCYDRAVSFYELFQTNTFDLSNRSVLLTRTGAGYSVTNGSTNWFTPVAPNLALTDDSVSPAQTLPFTLNYPGGSTTSIFVSSNGFVWAQTGGVNGCCAGDPSLLLAQGARWCPLWADWNPSVGGTVHFDPDPINNAAYVTFLGVPEFGGANLNTMQIAFFATGAVEFRYQTCSMLTHVALTGWSPGGGARDPGNRDLSASLPFVTTADQASLRLTGSPRPVLGNTVVLTTSNILPSVGVGATILSFTQHNPGLDLTSIGMPGCRQYVNLDSTQLFFPTGGTGSTNFFIPNNPIYTGMRVFAQSAAFVLGANPLGVLSSNGWAMLVGIL
jgi:hypothetical protein